MYITKVEIENIACFEHLELDFTNADGSPRMMTVLLGDNGAGKTTLLRAMCLAMAGWEAATVLLTDRQAYVRQQDLRGTPAARVRMDGAKGEFLPGEAHQPAVAGPPLTRYLLGYGTTRTSVQDPVTAQRRADTRIAPVVSLFDRSVGLPPFANAWIEFWPVVTDEDELATNGGDAVRQRESTAINALRTVVAALCGDSGQRLAADSGPVPSFEAWGATLDSEQLSDGYRSMMVLAGDILHHLRSLGTDDALLALPAIVLIDEVDLFLHPQWQRVVLQRLRDAFPRIQFVVTTHSPVTVLGAKEGEVVVLRREGDKVVADTDLPDVTGWRADQLLVSEFFGLSAAVSQDTEAKLARYQALRARIDRTGEEKAELAALSHEFLLAPYRLPGVSDDDLQEGLNGQAALRADLDADDAEQRRAAGLEILRRLAEQAADQ